MKKINEGIVFSNDIYRILEGKNALDFNYEKQGMKIPTKEEIEILRQDFAKDVKRIFTNKVEIIEEEEITGFLEEALNDIKEYPHCVTR